ncbi:hypothetical protein ACIQWA_04295 [Kitasatospora sp. NPDC098652]|uniref:hypothetical protein n=1 Tax=Kitasatospora sp. NPDC098652 TaxID=3364095 RepID=UPI00381C6DE4
MAQHGVRGGAGRRGFGRIGLIGRAGWVGRVGWGAAVTAGCAAAALAAGPSWAVRHPVPRPDLGVVAPGAAEASTLPAVVAKPSASHLEVVRIDPDPASPGGTTTIHAFVANAGPDTTASPFTVTVTLPDGVSADPPFYPTDCKVVARGRQVRCVFGSGLKEGRSATALVPVLLSPDLPLGVLVGGSVEVRSADDPGGIRHREPFDIRVVETTEG